MFNGMRKVYVFTFLLVLIISEAACAQIISVSIGEFFNKSTAYSQLKEFTRRSLKKGGIDAEFISMPLERATVDNVNGTLDAQMARVKAVLEKNPSLKGTSFPFAFTNIRFIYSKNRKNPVEEAKLNNYTGAISLNSKGLLGSKLSKELKLVTVRDIEQAGILFKKGRIDYLILPEEIALDLVNSHPFFKSEYRVSAKTLLQIDLYFVVSAKKAHLMPIIEKAFRESLREPHADLPLIQTMLNRSIK